MENFPHQTQLYKCGKYEIMFKLRHTPPLVSLSYLSESHILNKGNTPLVSSPNAFHLMCTFVFFGFWFLDICLRVPFTRAFSTSTCSLCEHAFIALSFFLYVVSFFSPRDTHTFETIF